VSSCLHHSILDLILKANINRPDQLLLLDDPAFIADMALPDLDFSNLNLGPGTSLEAQYSQFSSLASPGRSRSRSRSSSRQPINLEIPSEHGSSYQLPNPFQHGSSAHKDASAALEYGGDDDALLLDDLGLDFDFEALGLSNAAAAEHSGQAIYPGGLGRSDISASGRVRLDHDAVAGGLAERSELQFDAGGDFPMVFNDEVLPDADAFDITARGQQTENARLVSSISAEAPARRRKAQPKRIHPIADINRQELGNADLNAFQHNYLSNMESARLAQQGRNNTKLAKANARIFVWGNGLGGIGEYIRAQGGANHPLAMFAGDALMEALTGSSVALSEGGNKHYLEDGDEVEFDRRVRPRNDDGDEQPRALYDEYQLMNEDDEFLGQLDDSTEVGRDNAQDLLDHHSSALPWNISRSAYEFQDKDSFALTRAQANYFQRQSSVMSSRPVSELIPARNNQSFNLGSDDDQEPAVGLAFPSSVLSSAPAGSQLGFPATQFEAFGPSALVDTQTAQNSQWLADALENESKNFLEFVRASGEEYYAEVIARRIVAEEDRLKELKNGGGKMRDVVSREEKKGKRAVPFVTMFPEESTSKMVAAQAFLHVCTLATKGEVYVEQELEAPKWPTQPQQWKQKININEGLSVWVWYGEARVLTPVPRKKVDGSDPSDD
jgi:meiotic recombination protein REC8